MGERYSDNIGGWASAMEDAGFASLANQFRRDNGTKTEILERVKKAGLPIQASTTVDFSTFLENPEKVFTEFKFPLYWVSLMPKDPTIRKYTKVDVTPDQITEFVREHSGLAERYEILLSEFEKNIFGGQIISNRSVTLIEMARANQTDVAQGRVKGIYSARKSIRDISFQYSTQDSEMRAILWQVLQNIQVQNPPQRQTDIKFLEGYFEFAVTQSPTKPTLGVTFFDYKTGPSFLNLAA